MVGIGSCGAYIPFFRLKRETISRALGGPSARGEKAIANFDEDSITMAVAAAMDCLRDIDHLSVDAVYFASTTMPYREKQCAAIVAAALDLRRDVITSDLSTSLRAGTIALRSAFDAVRAGSAKKILVLVSDCRVGAPGSQFELVFGDGAAAFLVSDTDLIVTLEAMYTHTDEFIDIWRTSSDDRVNAWEDRYIHEKGYLRNIVEGVTNFLKAENITLDDLDKVVLTGAG